ncbi:MAG TPA: DUF2007 domain-containing protein [Solirubrobacterales bacterium]|nr:DUF2007 domain-containing protein [Solirubrobacterales bacterium]
MATGEDDPTPVAWANDEVEAGLIQGLLDDRGIPSSQQRMGLNGPMLGIPLLNPGGGARRILVSKERAAEAEALLAEIFTEGDAPGAPSA